LKVNAEGILLFSKRDHDITEIVLKMAFNLIGGGNENSWRKYKTTPIH
jgi:hypothetical protein